MKRYHHNKRYQSKL